MSRIRSNSPAPKCKIFLVDDHPIVRQGLALFVDREPDLMVCGEAEDAASALQAIREARDKGTLRIRLGKSDGTVWASFQDDGPGIPAENLPAIFDPFYTTKRPGRGTGLGLSICKAVISTTSAE